MINITQWVIKGYKVALKPKLTLDFSLFHDIKDEQQKMIILQTLRKFRIIIS
ncbi:MAG: hypothetical protein K0R92_1734 [Lachnospiraceae bacterium]|jgi:hypothetical protein|nr:hypothetical protein [Lachnospiraceae bacterium]